MLQHPLVHHAPGVFVHPPWSAWCGAASLSSPIPPLQGLAREVIRECGYFLGVGRFPGLGLFMQVLEGRSLSSFEHRVAAGTNRPLVWGEWGMVFHTSPSDGDVLLLCRLVRNQLCVGVFPVPYQEHFPPPALPALHASRHPGFYPPASGELDSSGAL